MRTPTPKHLVRENDASGQKIVWAKIVEDKGFGKSLLTFLRTLDGPFPELCRCVQIYEKIDEKQKNWSEGSFAFRTILAFVEYRHENS